MPSTSSPRNFWASTRFIGGPITRPRGRRKCWFRAGFKEIQGPPTFRYRGWFTNDEDLLTGWKPGLADGTGISLKTLGPGF